MKKNKIIWTLFTIFFCFDAYLGWYFASYYLPKFAPSEDHVIIVDKIVVEKALRKITLFSKGKVIDIYDISLGPNPLGDKEQDGDGRTPEGRYGIVEKNNKTKYHYALKISYPDKTDALDARKKQVDPGGDIFIHGYPNIYPDWLGKMLLKHRDWTDGSIGVSNDEIEKIWSYSRIGTMIEILP